MAGGKETPRQRMIGILYLVLLGLIALSIPDSLMDAFKNITNSLDKSRDNVNQSLKDTYSAFEKGKLTQEGEKAKKAYDEAKQATAIAGELNDYIESVKKELIVAGGGINETTQDVNARDNVDISPRIMINHKKADELREKVAQTRTKLLDLLGNDQKGVNFSLNVEDPVNKNGSTKKWQEAYFGDGIPLGAALTTLAKLQADNKNAENEVVKKLLGNVDKAQINLDQFKAVIVAPTSYILAGQPYTAQVFLTAYDKAANPTITVDGRSVPVTAGVGNFSSVYGEGSHRISASISVRGTDGTIKTYSSDPVMLTVARPSAVVSADKMNVLYIGVENPLSISAPGVAKESIHVSMTSGSLSGTGGHYVAKVSSIGETNITVTGDKGQVLGTTKFRTKRIPDPKAFFAGKSGGNTSAANIRAQDRIFARLDGFDFDAKFTVTHYTLLVVKPRQDAIIKPGSGSVLTGDMKTALNSVTPGSTVVFRDITAVGPDGVQREIDPIVLSATN